MKKIKILTLSLILLQIKSAVAFNFTEANYLYLARDFVKLEEICQEELKENDNSLEALFFLAALRMYQGKFNEALPYMKKFEIIHNKKEKILSKQNNNSKFMLIDSRFFILYYELGKYYFDKQEIQKAQKWLILAKAKFFNDPMLNFRLGICYQKEGKYDEARKYYKRQLKFAPEEPSPYYNIACTYALERNEKESIDWLRKAIKRYQAFREQTKKDKDFENISKNKAFLELVNE
jgi:tetratricopeptide (TPR) repeat protein